MQHDCVQQEEIGKIKEFINNTKGMRTAIGGIVVAIILQVGTFLFLWGGLMTTVKIHDKTIDVVCADMKSFSKLAVKLEGIKLVGYAHAESTK